MPRTVIDIPDELLAEAAKIFGTSTKAATVRAALDDAVKRRLRWEMAEAIKSGEFDLDHDVRADRRNAA